MGSPSTRVLDLLSLLQSRRVWSGPALAAALGVPPRTLRRDIDRLRGLGYEVAAARGTGGGYRLLPGREVPPLALSYEEAVAAVVGLRHVAAHETAAGEAAGAGEGPAATALRRIERSLPDRLRPRLGAVRAATEPAPAARESAGPATEPAPAARGFGPAGGDGAGGLAAFGLLASAAHGRCHARFLHTGRDGWERERRVEPYRQVLCADRWYLLAWDLDRAAWRAFRLDRVRRVAVPGSTFVPRPPPPPGAGPVFAAAYPAAGSEAGGEGGAPVGSVLFEAPAARVARTLAARAGTLRPAGPDRCRYVTGPDDWDWLAGAVAAVGVPYAVESPPELARATRRLAARAADAVRGPERER
ncbi:helix-turn-helix transcriptional regulator [Streptomyces phytohabitans]|uniref:helix-turn-helix transcriptional regulator n=1 Tax=Streptomyces phytohabitans TaxID=1150371 RepID=UPI00345BBC47